MSQQNNYRYRCPNADCPTRRGPVNSWWEIRENGKLRCPFCLKEYTRAQLEQERQNHINLIRGRRQPGRWPEQTRSTYCGHCNRQTMTLYGQNSNGQTTATCTECNPPSPPRPVTLGRLVMSPRSEARQGWRSRSSSPAQEVPPSQGVLFGNLYSPPSSPPRPSQEGKRETQEIGEKVDVGQIPSPNRAADALTQPVNSQSSPPSSPGGLSSGERALREGVNRRDRRRADRRRDEREARRLSVASRLAAQGRQPASGRTGYRRLRVNSPLNQRLQAIQDINRAIGYTPRVGVRRSPPPEFDRLPDFFSEYSSDEESEDEDAGPSKEEINELKKKIIKAKKKSTNQPAARHLLFEDSKSSKPKKPREAYDVYVGNAPITELLKDKDEDGDPQNNIILQRDTKPFNAVALPKEYLKNILTTNSYFNHTKYQCRNNITESLDVTQDNIVFDKENRETYQFINGKALNIPDGIFLRTQLLNMLNSQNKHFLYHVHKKINITPIASADKVRWFSPPKKIKGWTDNIPDWNSYEQGTALNEAHMEVGDMVSADHCQKGFTNFLITIAPMKKRRTAQFYSNRTKTKKKFGGRRKGGKRKTKKKKNKRKKKKKTRKKK